MQEQLTLRKQEPACMNQLLFNPRDDLCNDVFIDTLNDEQFLLCLAAETTNNMLRNKKLPFHRRQLNLHRTFPGISGSKRIVRFRLFLSARG